MIGASKKILGIDLGTSNSCVARNRASRTCCDTGSAGTIGTCSCKS